MKKNIVTNLESAVKGISNIFTAVIEATSKAEVSNEAKVKCVSGKAVDYLIEVGNLFTEATNLLAFVTDNDNVHDDELVTKFNIEINRVTELFVTMGENKNESSVKFIDCYFKLYENHVSKALELFKELVEKYTQE